MKKSRSTLFILGLLLLAPAGSSPAQPPPESAVPEIIAARSDAATQAAPWWVAAEVAAGPDGALHRDFFTPEAEERVQALLRNGTGSDDASPWSRMKRPGCDAVSSMSGESISTTQQPRDTLSDLARHAEWIVHAEVTHWRQGFLHGVPASLYALRPIETLRAPGAKGRPPDRFLLVHPFARIQMAGRTICGVDGRFPEHPEPGSKILVFSYPNESWTAEGDLYLRPGDTDYFFDRPDGTVSIPAHYGDLEELEELDLGFFLSKTRDALAALESSEEGGS